MFCFCSFRTFALFFTSNSVVFADRGRKLIHCPRAQGTLATPLVEGGTKTDSLTTGRQFKLGIFYRFSTKQLTVKHTSILAPNEGFLLFPIPRISSEGPHKANLIVKP